MKSKIIFLFLIIIFFSINLYAQAVIEFEKKTHDFNKVPEGTLATYDFKFTNTGTEPLIIGNVRASCGCTVPQWTKEPVPPGKSGSVTAIYTSKGRPGVFNKSITINSNATTPSSVVHIKGVVIPKESIERVYSEEEKANSPKVDLEKRSVMTGKIEKSQTIAIKVKVNNKGKSDLAISGLKSNCNCITLDEKSSNKNISPRESGTLNVMYTPRSLGSLNEVVTIFSNDIINPETKFTIQSQVVENLSNKSMLKEEGNSFKF